jgi:hypothetical protein
MGKHFVPNLKQKNMGTATLETETLLAPEEETLEDMLARRYESGIFVQDLGNLRALQYRCEDLVLASDEDISFRFKEELVSLCGTFFGESDVVTDIGSFLDLRFQESGGVSSKLTKDEYVIFHRMLSLVQAYEAMFA